MYVKMFESRRICIEDGDMKKLLKRFDASKFRLSPDKRCYENKTICALCDKYNKWGNYCSRCPFIQFKQLESEITNPRLGCSIVMNKLLHDLHSKKYRSIFTPIEVVRYCSEDSNVALEELKIITDFLRSFKKE